MEKNEHQSKRIINQDETLFRRILSNIPEAIVVYDNGGRVIYLNPAFSTLFGWAPGEILGKKMDRFVPPENWPETEGMIEKAVAGISISGIETRRYNKAGDIIPVSVSCSSYRDENGVLLGSIVNLRDISARKKAEDALQESELRHRILMDASPDPITVYDADGRVEYINPAFEKTFGWTEQEVLGKGIEFVPESEAEKTGKAVRRMLNRESVLLDTLRLTKSGALLDIQLKTANYYDCQGAFAGNIVIYRDISQRVRYEKKIQGLNRDLESRVAQRTAQLESANRELKAAIRRAEELARKAEVANTAKSEFLANMSHEIRTPINGIMVSADLLLSDRPDPKTEELVGIIRESGDALMTIVEDILDFSKIETGRTETETVRFSPKETLERLYGPFARKAEEKDIQFIPETAPGLPPVLEGDPAKLVRVVRHLFDNAIKFTEKGGTVSITVQLQDTVTPGGGVVLEMIVKDTGAGIRPEHMEGLFDPFTQADASSTREHGGTGLGLALCRHLVESMGGRIRMDSEWGKGTTVRFSAVFRSPATSSRPARAAHGSGDGRSRGSVKGANILVAEDNPVNQLMIKKVLAKAGVTVTVAANGRKAVDALKENSFDAVLMDIQMPEMDGYQATGQIRSVLKNREIPIIAMTANALEGDEEKCLAAGMDSYTTKPLDQEKFFQILSELIEKKQ